jgi:cephalosporin-C deacetylase-like acetyl esterase
VRFCSRLSVVTRLTSAALVILISSCRIQPDNALYPATISLKRSYLHRMVSATHVAAADFTAAERVVNDKDEPKSDGRILSSKPWTPLPNFDSLDDFSRNYFPRAVYEEARAQKEFDVLEITYSSDGIPVRGMLIKPKVPGDRKWPAIIFNRGGTGDYGRITDDGVTPCSRTNPSCLTVVDLYQFSKAGFVVIASDYRFHGPTAKRDEWGGVDVDDVLNLVPALQSFDFVDLQRVYMLGISRGGTMAYIALKRGIPVKAAAVIAGPSDLKAWADLRPDLVKGDDTYDGFSKVWPDYDHRSAEQYYARSAVCWADQINVPVLILHSRTDNFVPVTQALQMATALQSKGKVYALHIYDHDGHSLPLNREDRNRKIIAWFNEFGGTPGVR